LWDTVPVKETLLVRCEPKKFLMWEIHSVKLVRGVSPRSLSCGRYYSVKDTMLVRGVSGQLT